MTPQNLRAVGDRIEQAARRAARRPPIRAPCDQAEELLRLVTELYGAGLARVVELAAERRARARSTGFVDDELVASLLLVHGLHPESLDSAGRGGAGVGAAVPRPSTAATSSCSTSTTTPARCTCGCSGSCDGCPSSAVTLQHAVERAIVEAAPEIAIIDVEAAVGRGRRTAGDRHAGDRSTRKPSRLTTQCPTEVARAMTRTTRSRVLRRIRAARRRRRSPGRASAASCAASRSPTSTATSSTSKRAASCARAGGCYLLFTPDGRGRRPLPGGARALPRVPRLRAVAGASGTRCRSR